MALLDYREELLPPEIRRNIFEDELHKPTPDDIETLWRLAGHMDDALDDLIHVTAELVDLIAFDHDFYRRLMKAVRAPGAST